MPFDKSHYRQHYFQRYIPSPILLEEPYHWTLRWLPARLMLLAILRRSSWRVPVPRWGKATQLDFELDLLVDYFGLRNVPEPCTLGQKLSMAWRCLMTFVKVEAQLL